MPRRAALDPADLLHLAASLDTIVLTFPQQPGDELQAAARVLQAACQRVAVACASVCHILRLPDEVLMRVLCELKSNQLAAFAATCRAVNDGSPSLINRGAQLAIARQYSAELAALPPAGLRAQGQLGWLERAAVEAQHWLKEVGPRIRNNVRHNELPMTVIWPKAERCDESRWLEAMARFGARGRDLTVLGKKENSILDVTGEYAREGVRAALLFLSCMATRTSILADANLSEYERQEGNYPQPGITAGAVQWVAAQVPSMCVENELPLADFIMRKLMEACKADWKTRDQAGTFFTDGDRVVMRTYALRENYEPLLRALLDARSAAHGPDDGRTLRARVDLGEVLAAAAAVQPCPDRPSFVQTLRWGEVPHGDADAVLADALSTVRRLDLELTAPLAVRTCSVRAGWLSQRGLFAGAAALLREVRDLQGSSHRAPRNF